MVLPTEFGRSGDEALKKLDFYLISQEEWEAALAWIESTLNQYPVGSLSAGDIFLMRTIKTIGRLTGRNTPIDQNRELDSFYELSVDDFREIGRRISPFEQTGVDDQRFLSEMTLQSHIEHPDGEAVDWEQQQANLEKMWALVTSMRLGLVVFSAEAGEQYRSHLEKRGSQIFSKFIYETRDKYPKGADQFDLMHSIGWPLMSDLRAIASSYEEAIKNKNLQALAEVKSKLLDYKQEIVPFFEKWEADGLLLSITHDGKKFQREILPTPLKKDQFMKEFEEIVEVVPQAIQK